MADLFIGFAILILLSAAGVARKEDQALAAKRDVARLVTCADPADRTLEFYHGGTVPKEEFVSPTEVRFVTKDPDGKDMGLGHIVLSFSDLDQALDFYLGTLGFTIAMRPRVVATFTYVNPWHHSLALVRAQPESGPSLNHFMLEVADVDMVGRTLDRVHEKGVSMFASLGGTRTTLCSRSTWISIRVRR